MRGAEMLGRAELNQLPIGNSPWHAGLYYPVQDEGLWSGQGNTMTLISVVKETEESLLIAADNLEQISGRFSVTPRSKLRRGETGIFAWTCSGDATIAGRLSDHLRDNIPVSWEAITNFKVLPTQVARLNANQRTIVALAGSQWRDDYGITCVMAGCLDGDFDVWDIDANGLSTPHWDRGVLFEGSLAQFADVAWAVLDGTAQSPIEKLNAVYSSISVSRRTIDGTPDVWRISSQGIAVVQGRDEKD